MRGGGRVRCVLVLVAARVNDFLVGDVKQEAEGGAVALVFLAGWVAAIKTGTL